MLQHQRLKTDNPVEWAMAKTDDLTADFLRQVLEYNPDTGVFIRKYRPDKSKAYNAQWAGKIAGSVNGDGYVCINIDRVSYLASRLAFLYVNGHWPNGEVDHDNHDKTDNRISNLRDSTHSQNQHNRSAYSNNTSGYKGVSYKKANKKWFAHIRVNGKRIHLGYFFTPKDAHNAYQKAAKIYHGKFARFF